MVIYVTGNVFPMPPAKVEFASACLVTKEMVIVAALQVMYYIHISYLVNNEW